MNVLAFFFIDPMYFIFVGPAILFGIFAQAKVKSAYAQGSKHQARSGLTGAETAQRILNVYGVANVGIEPVKSFLGDHYDPKHKMLRLSPEEILAFIKPCGLAPRKSEAISKLSQLLVEKHNGEVPASFADLEALPGVGHKTASVVMAQAFGVPAFPVDTHIHRLAYRWTLSTGKSVEKTEKDLKRIFPKEHWIKLHLQIIYFGREYCPAKNHLLDRCPICGKIGRKSMFI